MIERLLLVAGGTGGHIWPAISFGKWIEQNHSDVTVSYVCGDRPAELEMYGSAGISPEVLAMEGSPFSGSNAKQRMERAKALFAALGAAKRILREQKPSCVVMFGGYLSFPFLLACKKMRVPCIMHEQNALAGRVTKIASALGVDVLSGWRDCRPLKTTKYTRVGVPVRTFEKIAKDEAWKRLGLPGAIGGRAVSVVFTGSLGSAAVKESIRIVSEKPQFSRTVFLMPALSGSVEKIGDNVYLLPKIWDPAPLFSLADSAVVRGGGSTLTEIGCMGIPALIVPWRKAVGDHQYFNAVSFLSENTGIMLDAESDTEAFALKLQKLAKIANDCRQKENSKLYNSAERICEQFWLALVSRF